MRDFKIAVFANRGNLPLVAEGYPAVINDPVAQGAAIASAVSRAVVSDFAFAESVVQAEFALPAKQ